MRSGRRLTPTPECKRVKHDRLVRGWRCVHFPLYSSGQPYRVLPYSVHSHLASPTPQSRTNGGFLLSFLHTSSFFFLSKGKGKWLRCLYIPIGIMMSIHWIRFFHPSFPQMRLYSHLCFMATGRMFMLRYYSPLSRSFYHRDGSRKHFFLV